MTKPVSAREVLADFMLQGHLTYREGMVRASDYDRADAMIRDLEAEGLCIVPRACLDELSDGLERIANFAPDYGEIAEKIAQLARHALYPELREMFEREHSLQKERRTDV